MLKSLPLSTTILALAAILALSSILVSNKAQAEITTGDWYIGADQQNLTIKFWGDKYTNRTLGVNVGKQLTNNITIESGVGFGFSDDDVSGSAEQQTTETIIVDNVAYTLRPGLIFSGTNTLKTNYLAHISSYYKLPLGASEQFSVYGKLGLTFFDFELEGTILYGYDRLNRAVIDTEKLSDNVTKLNYGFGLSANLNQFGEARLGFERFSDVNSIALRWNLQFNI